jgi:cyclophilin family peptidyl-prolyl cis-trans isomerase
MARYSDRSTQGSQFYIVQNKKLSDDLAEEMERYKTIQNQVAGKDQSGNPMPIAQIFPLRILDKYLEDGGVPALDYRNTVFGQTIEGFDVIDKIAAAPASQEDAELYRPLEDIVLETVTFEKYNS